MKRFLGFVGVIQLLAYIVGIVLLAVYITFVGPNIAYFVLYVIFGPTMGILCLSVADLLDRVDTIEAERKVKKEEEQMISKQTTDSKINSLEKYMADLSKKPDNKAK